MTVIVTQTERLEQFALHDDVAKSYGVAQGVVLIDPLTGLPYSASNNIDRKSVV
jgi:hypothetical protein